jgi:predicted CXXCH cytochrome family protein
MGRTVERYQPIVIRVLVACFAAISAALLMGAILIYPGDVGIKQPIPFSHRVHAGNKGIGCVMCHPHALTRPVAGIPPVETCMLCHMRIIIHYPPVEDVRQHYKEGKPILWIRVSDLPDFAQFNHGVHLAAGIDCGKCHGDIKSMDRVLLHRKFIMGFCMQCHREHDATRDCFACHY